MEVLLLLVLSPLNNTSPTNLTTYIYSQKVSQSIIFLFCFFAPSSENVMWWWCFRWLHALLLLSETFKAAVGSGHTLSQAGASGQGKWLNIALLCTHPWLMCPWVRPLIPHCSISAGCPLPRLPHQCVHCVLCATNSWMGELQRLTFPYWIRKDIIHTN